MLEGNISPQVPSASMHVSNSARAFAFAVMRMRQSGQGFPTGVLGCFDSEDQSCEGADQLRGAAEARCPQVPPEFSHLP